MVYSFGPAGAGIRGGRTGCVGKIIPLAITALDFSLITAVMNTGFEIPCLSMISRGFSPDIGVLLSVLLVPCIVVLCLLLLLAWGVSRIQGRKNQLLASMVLLAVAILSGLVPALFSGEIPESVRLVCMVSGVLVVPLAVIMPGILWFWPDERKYIVRDTLLCSGLILVMSIAISAVVVQAVPEPAIVSAWSWVTTVLTDLPVGLQVALVLVFSGLFLLSCASYRVLGMITHRASSLP